MHQIKDMMSRDVQVVSPEDTLADAARRMRDGDFGLMPVGQNDRMIGTVSDRDIVVRGVAMGLGVDAKVREVMSDGVCWAYEDESVDHAAGLMSRNQVRRLPIVDRDKRLVGILSLGDIAIDSSEKQPAGNALSGISEHA